MEKAESNLQIVGKYRLREASSFIFRNKLTFACLSFFLSFYLIQFQSSWPGLRISGVRGYRDFIYQQSILDSADCFKK
jgi:hypothetical protein